jgi:hypothetical protein
LLAEKGDEPVQVKKDRGFCIERPRAVKLTAVVDNGTGVVLLYDSAGE